MNLSASDYPQNGEVAALRERLRAELQQLLADDQQAPRGDVLEDVVSLDRLLAGLYQVAGTARRDVRRLDAESRSRYFDRALQDVDLVDIAER